MVSARLAVAQVVFVPIQPAQPARYLLTTQASDARALWVNPAGLSRRIEASLSADVTADRFLTGTELSQYGTTLSSRGVAIGWVHDRYPDGASVNSYALGLGLGDERLSIGAVRRWVRGSVSGSAWDLAARTASQGGTQLSLVAKNLGSPKLGDSTYWASFIPGALVGLLGGKLQAAGEWEIAPHGWRSVEYRFAGALALTGGLALMVRADLAPDFKRRGFTVALAIEAPRSRAGAFAQLPGGAGQVDAFGAFGALVARTAPTRR
jgi:hypothetical protein